MVQFCSSKGKYLTSTAHELRKMTIDSHVTLPFDVTMTLVLMDDLYDDTSALYGDNAHTSASESPDFMALQILV